MRRGSEKGKRTLRADSALIENVKPKGGDMESVEASAAADFKAMQEKEGDPFAAKRRQVDVGPYKPKASDVKKGVIEDPGVFKGADAPYGEATLKQKGAFRVANAQVKASTAEGDRKGAEKARKKMNKLGQFPGVSSGVSHSCFGSNCPNEVTPSESVLCTDCESRDSTKVQVGAVSGAAASRSRTREQKSA
jgi:hypothetical protein